MVSALWKACAAEAQDIEGVQQLLAESGVDLEIKDHTGTTPLIQAVRNGHKDIVKALLAAGADPNNSSSQGRPDTYTSDPEMLALLQPKHQPPQQSYEGFSPSHDPNAPYDPTMQPYYYPGPPGHEGPYQPYAYPMLSPPEGQPPMSGFMPSGDSNSPGGVPNLPPADIARTIPCRYFPVCRYGSSCMFLHPQPPYFSGPPPPAHPHYPPMYPPQGYYMMRPGAYPAPGAPPVEPVASPVANTQPFPPPAPLSYPPPPNGVPPFSPATNGAPFPPPVNGAPFPNGAPYPPPTNGAPYPPPNGAPYTPISTGTPYTPATNGTPSPYGPPPFSPGSATPFSAGAPFTPGPVPAPYPYPRAYPDAPKDAPVNGNVNVNGNGEEHQQPPAANGMNGTGNHVNGGFLRRGGRGGRRESFGQGRQSKPACLFFPSGRCRNGDDCRFPHVLPEPGSQPAFRYPPNGHNHNNNGAGRYGHRPRPSMGHHDGPPPAHIPPANQLNGSPNQQQQRVPNADDFPVLRSAASAPDTPNGLERASALNGSGLTAAQVLQAPPPAKKGKADAESVGELADALSKVHMNGLAASGFDATPATPEIAAVGA